MRASRSAKPSPVHTFNMGGNDTARFVVSAQIFFEIQRQRPNEPFFAVHEEQ
jgi:hypothetical protein